MGRRGLGSKFCVSVGLVLMSACSSISFERGATRGELGGAVPAAVADPTPEPIEADLREIAPVEPTATVAAQPSETPTPAAAESPTPEATATVHVSSWWKLGGTPSGLDADVNACVAALGPEHRPNANATIVTHAMQQCLRQRGWRAVGVDAP